MSRSHHIALTFLLALFALLTTAASSTTPIRTSFPSPSPSPSFNLTPSCPLHPPYTNANLLIVLPTTNTHLVNLRNLAALPCTLRLIEPSSFALHVHATVLATSAALPRLRQLFAATSPRALKLLSSDFSSYVSNSSTQHSHYIPSSSSSSTSSNNLLTPRSNANNSTSMDFTFYKRYWQWNVLEQKWRNLSLLYPSLVSLQTIGKSVEGRPIRVLRIGRTDEKRPRRILLNALQHAREWVTVPTVTYIAEQLALSATTNPSGTTAQFLQQVQVLIIPMVNPDGYIYSHETDRLWRKNRRPGTCTQRQGTDNGVDLNRNWATDFGGIEATSRDPCSDLYIGASAFSEPETAAVHTFIKSTPGIRAHLDVHSYGRLILGPWAYSKSEPPRPSEIDRVGTMLATNMTNVDGQQYRYGRPSVRQLIYLASGVMSDWTFAQGIMSFTIELRPGGESMLVGFNLPETQILKTCREGMAAVDALLHYATGTTTDNSLSVETPSQTPTQSPRDPREEQESLQSSTSGGSKLLPVILGAGAVVVLLALAAIAFFVMRAHRKKGFQESDIESMGRTDTMDDASPS